MLVRGKKKVNQMAGGNTWSRERVLDLKNKLENSVIKFSRDRKIESIDGVPAHEFKNSVPYSVILDIFAITRTQKMFEIKELYRGNRKRTGILIGY